MSYYGHSIQVIQLTKELDTKGFHVGYISLDIWAEEFEKTNIEFIPYSVKNIVRYMQEAYRIAEKVAPKFELIVYEMFSLQGISCAKN